MSKDSVSMKKADVLVDSCLTDGGFETTDSKAIIIYRDFISKRIGTGLFTTSLGLFLSTLATLTTSTFNDLGWLDPSTLRALFLIVCIISGIATIVGFIWMIIGFVKYNEKAFIKRCHSSGISYVIQSETQKAAPQDNSTTSDDAGTE